jgi:cell wall-associated NlpC family hydrolase
VRRRPTLISLIRAASSVAAVCVLALSVAMIPGATISGLAQAAFAAPVDPIAPAPTGAASSVPRAIDFWLASAEGGVWSFGRAGSYPPASSAPLTSPVVAITPTADAQGYWLITSGGDVRSFGDAQDHGSTGGTRLTRPIVGMAATPDGGGYWLVASDGGIFAFGDAPFRGSTGAIALNKPIVGMAATSDGAGYWLVASDGGIFAFGDATFHGSTGAIRLAQPIVSMTTTPAGSGYWLLAADGGIFNFGDARFAGSDGGHPAADPAEKVVAGPDQAGYWIFDQNGSATAFGDAGGRPPIQGLLFHPVTPGDKAVFFAFQQLGKPYIWGGNGPTGYDCSGLALASWQRAAGIGFARVANDQYHTAGTAVALDDLSAGDLVFWGSTSTDWTSVYHTAIYVGGGRIVEATGDHVQLNSLSQWGLADVMPHGMRP